MGIARRAGLGSRSGRGRLVVGMVLVGVLCATLAGCGGSGGAGTAPETRATAGSAASASGGADLLQPQKPAKQRLAFHGAGPGDGSPQVSRDGSVCVFWTWNTSTGAPPLEDGLAFVVDSAGTDPAVYAPDPAGCAGAGGGVPWCAGARLASDATTCLIGLVPRAGVAGAAARIVVVGTLDCSAVDADVCATASQILAAINGAPPMEIPAREIPASPDPTPDETPGGGDG